MITWFGAGLLATFTALSTTKIFERANTPSFLVPFLITSIIITGVALGFARVGFEWEATKLRRKLDDGSVADREQLRPPEDQWPAQAERFWIVSALDHNSYRRHRSRLRVVAIRSGACVKSTDNGTERSNIGTNHPVYRFDWIRDNTCPCVDRFRICSDRSWGRHHGIGIYILARRLLARCWLSRAASWEAAPSSQIRKSKVFFVSIKAHLKGYSRRSLMLMEHWGRNSLVVFRTFLWEQRLSTWKARMFTRKCAASLINGSLLGSPDGTAC